DLDRSQGFAQIIDGRVFYSPNSSRIITVPPRISDPETYIRTIRQDTQYLNKPQWWSYMLAYLPFIPLNPQFSGEPLECLSRLPGPVFLNGKFVVNPRTQVSWKQLESDLVETTKALLQKYDVVGIPPGKPSVDLSKCFHNRDEYMTSLKNARDWFAAWVGTLSYTLAIANSLEPPSSLADRVPAWFSYLAKRPFTEIWLDSVRSSSIGTFEYTNLRVGVLLDILCPSKYQCSVDWLCNLHVPTWYPWGQEEIKAAGSNPDIARLAPLPDQLQKVATFLTMGVSSGPWGNWNTTEHWNTSTSWDNTASGSDFSANKRSRVKDPWEMASADTSSPVSPQVPSSSTPPIISGKKTWESFFERRKASQKKYLANETPRQKQSRESKMKNPSRKKGVLVFEWTLQDDGSYKREKVNKSEWESVFQEYGAYQTIFDPIACEWDLCDDFGPQDMRQIDEEVEEEADCRDIPVEEYVHTADNINDHTVNGLPDVNVSPAKDALLVASEDHDIFRALYQVYGFVRPKDFLADSPNKLDFISRRHLGSAAGFEYQDDDLSLSLAPSALQFLDALGNSITQINSDMWDLAPSNRLAVKNMPRLMYCVKLETNLFILKDYEAYVVRRDAFLCSARGRAALLKGGIVWRLAVEALGFDVVFDGPSNEAQVHGRGFRFGDDGTSFCDDDLSEDELDLISGIYHCHTGVKKQIAKKSWFPLHTTWRKAATFTHWTERNENEYQRRVQQIQQGSQPLSASEWAKNAKYNSQIRRL
ncbi:hypothetical protein BDZ97DRAFT_1592947, partial [Flammula alnicola]